MNDDGYTLAEMLVALVMVGLAISGMSLAARSVAQAEGRVRGQHDVALALDRLRNAAGGELLARGPFTTADRGPVHLRGVDRAAKFDCGLRPCEIELQGAVGRQAVAFDNGDVRRLFPLSGLNALKLAYVSAIDGRETDVWPPADRSDGLGALVILNVATPILVLATPVSQSPNCMFDAALHGCRPAGVS